MYISSVNSIAASWLFLIIPFYSRAERSDWIPHEANDPVHYQFRPIQPESVSLEEQLPNVPKPPQYNIHYPKYNSVQSGIASKDRHSEDEVKLNVTKSIPEYLREVDKPYYYSQFVGNERTPKEESAARLERKEIGEIDKEIMKKMNMLDKILSEDTVENDVEKNTVEDGIIAEINLSEETKRVVRQVRKYRPGFFWTLAKLAFETFNDTRSAIKQISNIISQNIEPDPTTRRSASNHPLVVDTTTIAPSIGQNNTSSGMAGVNATTTTQAPFRLTPTNLQNLILRNVRGLVRLFNIEWQDAMNQSEMNVKEFQKNLGNEVGRFLQDNPNAF
ncbi:PREDICTED: uncharacterized protein LOC105562198 [Vollenhovia emeryi]|uniref:uncharacterized protein LOC105562198 n=1 Tax=Vollenhovia emeryi TaxID=411798 RepID=UPI0005F4AAD0|nr:PREDICTED: uncharacterized protein LOC105562198 [Vollenhovia emeryi]XP_011868227.1 PREDICTED: uncharacterized protein LOC105562198 [Vollenhovia emeryi]XP_011868228.1 PREDICTED: uncharacterized protein LOC105562198 [Vollenhovia emeryi]